MHVRQCSVTALMLVVQKETVTDGWSIDGETSLGRRSPIHDFPVLYPGLCANHISTFINSHGPWDIVRRSLTFYRPDLYTVSKTELVQLGLYYAAFRE